MRKMVKKLRPGKMFILYDPLYCVEHVFYVGTWGQWMRLLQKRAPDAAEAVQQDMPHGASGACGGHTYKRTEGPDPKRATFHIFVERGESARDILSHESLHAAIAVMELIGHDAGKVEGSEPLTYYHDWLVREGKKGLGL